MIRKTSWKPNGWKLGQGGNEGEGGEEENEGRSEYSELSKGR